MNTIAQKIAAALCVSALWFGFVLFDYARWRGIGKLGFLEHQSDHFDRFIATPGSQLLFTFLSALFFSAVLVGAYELVLFLLRKGSQALALTSSLSSRTTQPPK